MFHPPHWIWYCFWQLFYLFCSSIVINTVIHVVTAGTFEPKWKREVWRFKIWFNPPFSLEMPVPSQGHYGFHSFPVVDWFCLFIYLWVLTFPLEDCSEFGNLVITLIYNDNNNLRLFIRRAAVLPLVLSELVEGLWFNALEDSKDVAPIIQPRYSYIVKSGIKHPNPNPYLFVKCCTFHGFYMNNSLCLFIINIFFIL
jgi:hypothetical protein